MRSASTMGRWWTDDSRDETVDLPEAIPPVRPTTVQSKGPMKPSTPTDPRFRMMLTGTDRAFGDDGQGDLGMGVWGRRR